ncbi:hypothetical protein V8B55DRAFT_1571985 [Mucor lusitanicus]|uniref:Man1/Src1-like C-terminal domain-containing protein n=2 Tax=Mucor circinelloides f. lusitanicus TaxID=29924 RepID=A0A168PKK9_MUCCL|nr:hypothetical protein FB192DRAFT_1471676 [Mucor lusitanicus]OAD07863.1 hypothetical protein MUCCIDRAFT_104807 [Mucor lusitanicus CBS 277.49]
MSTERVFDTSDDDSDYTSEFDTVSDDDNNSAVDTMSENELVRLYKDQSVNVHELLSFSDDDDTDDDAEKRIDKKELVGLYNDQQAPIEELAPILNVEASNKSGYNMTRRISLGPYLIKFAIPVAVAFSYIEPIFRQSHDENQCLSMNTTEMFIIKTVYLVFILCAPVVLINYRYKIKIDALVHDIIVELQAKKECHTKYPHICFSAAVSVTHIRSSIVTPTHLSTFEDWQCVQEKLNAHPLLRKTMQEERGDFIEYWEILI